MRVRFVRLFLRPSVLSFRRPFVPSLVFRVPSLLLCPFLCNHYCLHLRSFVPLLLRLFHFCRVAIRLAFTQLEPSQRICVIINVGGAPPGCYHDRAVDVRGLLRVLRAVAGVVHHRVFSLIVPLHWNLEDVS